MAIVSAQVGLIYGGIPLSSLDAVASALNTFAVGEYKASRLPQSDADKEAQLGGVAEVMAEARSALVEREKLFWERTLFPAGPGPDQTLRISRFAELPANQKPGDCLLEIIHGKADRSAEQELADHLKVERLLERVVLTAQVDPAVDKAEREVSREIATIHLGMAGFDKERVKVEVAPRQAHQPEPIQFINTDAVSTAYYLSIAPAQTPFFTDLGEGKALIEVAEQLAAAMKSHAALRQAVNENESDAPEHG